MGEKMAACLTWFAQILASIVVAFLGDWLLAIIAFAMLPITVVAAGMAAKVFEIYGFNIICCTEF